MAHIMTDYIKIASCEQQRTDVSLYTILIAPNSSFYIYGNAKICHVIRVCNILPAHYMTALQKPRIIIHFSAVSVCMGILIQI